MKFSIIYVELFCLVLLIVAFNSAHMQKFYIIIIKIKKIIFFLLNLKNICILLLHVL